MSPLLQSILIGLLLLLFSLPLIVINFGKYAVRLVGIVLQRRSKFKRQQIFDRLKLKDTGKRPIVFGFFHPYCNAGGGGERVLWTAIRTTQQHFPNVVSIVYTGDHVPKERIIQSVRTRFDIELDPSTLEFIHLSGRRYVDSATWPRFTLLGQSLGSLILAFEAFQMLVPDVYVDTMGYAFSVLLAKGLFRIPTGAYVHYPTISSDMLGSLSPAQGLKKVYWQLFALLYGSAGSGVDVVTANSTWTAEHIRGLWKSHKDDVEIVFPPCATDQMAESVKISKDENPPREKTIVCIAQFRPEKNHEMLIRAFAKFLDDTDNKKLKKDAKLVLIGSVRHEEDEKKVYELRLLTNELKIRDNVEFVINATWGEILERVQTASVGANAMWNEHFGIGVVEYQAAGLISVVHDSGGPKRDIVVEIDGGPTGFHATNVETFAAAFENSLTLPADEAYEMRLRARKSSARFSEKVFENKWKEVMRQLLDLEKETGGGWKADVEYKRQVEASKSK